MKIDRITVVASVTLPTVSFGNVKPSVEIGATLEDGDQLGDVHDALMRAANDFLARHVVSLVEVQNNARRD